MKDVLLVIAVCLLVACGASDKELVEAAKKYISEKQVREAKLELKNALQVNPKNAEARYLLGKINMEVGDFATAKKEFEHALEEGWSSQEVVIEKMRAMLALGEYKGVVGSTMSVDDWSASAHANMLAIKAVAIMSGGDLLQAKNMLDRAENIEADAYDVMKATVQMQLLEKQYENARTALARALKLYPDDSALLLLKGNLAINEKNIEEAINVYKRVIEFGSVKIMTPDTRRAHIGLLKLAVMKKDFDLVHKSRDVLLARNADDPEVNYFAAIAALEEKKLEQANGYLQKILKISAEHAPTLLLIGAVNYERREYEKAAYFLSKYIASNPEDIKARKLLGRTYMALGQYDDAQGAFNTALNEHASDPELIALLGLSEIGSGNRLSGIAGLEKALVMRPDSGALKMQLARAYILDGKTKAAIKHLDEMLEKGDDDFQIRKMKVLAYLRDQNIKMALIIMQQMLEDSPQNPSLLSLMGRIQIVTKNTDEARRYFNEVLNIEPDNVAAETSLAHLDERSGDLSSAEKRYLSILDKNPESINVMADLARLAALHNDTNKQIKWLQMVRKIAPKELMSRVALVEIYLRKENLIEAEELIRELDSEHAKVPAVLVVKSRLLMVQKRLVQAEKTIRKLIEVSPDLDIGYYLLALNQLLLNDKQKALGSVRKAYALNSLSLKNIILFARIEQGAGNFERALKLGEEVLNIMPDFADGHVIVGDALMSVKKYQQALSAYDKAWAVVQSQVVAKRRYKAVRKLTGVDDASNILLKWLEKNPDDAAVALELATVYLTERQNKKAIIYFEKVLELKPNNIIALNDLAWLYDLENNPRALGLAEKAYELKPDSPSITDTYGWILLKNGKVIDALKMLKQSFDKLSDIPEVQYHYAKALFISGDKVKAEKILKPLIASGKVFAGRNDAEKMLGQ